MAKSIAKAFNEITVAQGGTPDDSGTIVGAIDALSDTLAGEDVASPNTVAGAISMLGDYIDKKKTLDVGAQVTFTTQVRSSGSSGWTDISPMYAVYPDSDSATPLASTGTATVASGKFKAASGTVVDIKMSTAWGGVITVVPSDESITVTREMLDSNKTMRLTLPKSETAYTVAVKSDRS